MSAKTALRAFSRQVLAKNDKGWRCRTQEP